MPPLAFRSTLLITAYRDSVNRKTRKSHKKQCEPLDAAEKQSYLYNMDSETKQTEESMKKLTRKQSTTQDANGCEFRCTLVREWDGGEIVWQKYSGCGQRENTLEELKKAIADI